MLQETRRHLSSSLPQKKNHYWNGTATLFPWFGSECLLAVSKNKVCIKRTKISGYWRHPKIMRRQHWKIFHNRSSKNVEEDLCKIDLEQRAKCKIKYKQLEHWKYQCWRYSFGVINWNQKEIQELEKHTKKIITIHAKRQSRADIDRLYVPR
jgi:hypothetical protein